jgi:hypothetical protein
MNHITNYKSNKLYLHNNHISKSTSTILTEIEDLIIKYNSSTNLNTVLNKLYIPLLNNINTNTRLLKRTMKEIYHSIHTT